jgi:electron transfer flavoprotein alpha subunit
MSILVIAEHNNSSIQASTLNTIAAATELKQDIVVLVIGKGAQAAADSAATVAGVSKVLLAEDGSCEHATAEQIANQVLAIADNYDYFLAPATTFGKNFMPRVAAKLGVAQISDIIAIVDADTFKRPIYAGNAIATVKSRDSKKVITIRSTGFDAAALGGSAAVESIEFSGSYDKSSFVSQELTKSERPELTAASIIISGGRGMQSGDNFHLLEDIADKLGAAVGASRAAVDAGFVPNDYQVGQTGKIVAPDLYIAVGISGAIQHLAGMKDSKVIVAINKDEEAPIFQVADYGLVMDLFDALPQLSAALD